MGVERGVGDAVFFEEFFESFDVAGAELSVAHAKVGVIGINEVKASSLWIAEVDFSDFRKTVFGGVGKTEGDEFVAVGEEREGAGEIGVEEVREKEDEGFSFEGAEKEFGGGGKVGGFLSRVGGEDFSDEAEDMWGSFSWRNEEDGLIGEEEKANFVAIREGWESEDGGDFGSEFLFAEVLRSVLVRGGDIDSKDDAEFSFFSKLADVGGARAGGDVPVDVAGFVSVLVFAVVVEVEALAFEGGVVFAWEGFGDEFFGTHL